MQEVQKIRFKTDTLTIGGNATVDIQRVEEGISFESNGAMANVVANDLMFNFDQTLYAPAEQIVNLSQRVQQLEERIAALEQQ